MTAVEFQDWGLIDYEEALARQMALVEKTSELGLSGTVVFCTHPAIVTLGRKTQAQDVFAWSGPIKEISRGGRATYHGPSQLVIYPIVNLNYSQGHRPLKDIGWYLRTLENCIVSVLQDYGITAQGKSLQKKSMTEDSSEETGVWVGSKKIASLGIGVRKWVTFHGAAINLDEDPTAFAGMRPCGFDADVMVSLEKLFGQPVNRQAFANKLKQRLLESL